MENYQSSDDELFDEDKRSVSTLARLGLLRSGKRNVAAMARARSGLSQSTSPDGFKRSIATLAKNGQLPSKEPDAVTSSSMWLDDKRNIGSMARAGNLNYYGKRNLASIMRSNYNAYTKRNMASLARSNMWPSNDDYKRNVGTLARDWALPNRQTKIVEGNFFFLKI